MTLIRTLITGGATPELEAILAEGVGMVPGSPSSDAQSSRHRCRLTQIALYDGPFVDFGVSYYIRLYFTEEAALSKYNELKGKHKYKHHSTHTQTRKQIIKHSNHTYQKS